MEDTIFKVKRGIYIAIGYLILALGVLLLIIGLTLSVSYKNVLITIAIILMVGSIGYYFIAVALINNLKNKYKELIIMDAFTSRQFFYFSRQKGINDKNKYSFTRNEFESLNYYKCNEDFSFLKNELVVGSIRNIDFRSMDYKYISESKNIVKCGRIYSLNLKSDKGFVLLITKNSEQTNLKKMDLKLLGLNFYTNNIDLANKYIIEDKFSEKIEKLFHYNLDFIKVYNGSIYFILDGIKESFDLENRTYNDITQDVEKEIFIINCFIDSFKFEPNKPKLKPLKIK